MYKLQRGEIKMNEKKEWQKVASMERRTKNYKKDVKQRCIKNIAKGILKIHRVPVYEKDRNGKVLTDQNGNRILKKRSYTNKDGQRKIHVKTRKLLGYGDFKNHFIVIPKRENKKLNLVKGIAKLIVKINKLESKTTDLNEIKNGYSEKLQSLENSQDGSDQSNQQQNNTDTDSNIDSDKKDQNFQINPDNSDKKKNQDSDQSANFDNQNLDPNDFNFSPTDHGEN